MVLQSCVSMPSVSGFLVALLLLVVVISGWLGLFFGWLGLFFGWLVGWLAGCLKPAAEGSKTETNHFFRKIFASGKQMRSWLFKFRTKKAGFSSFKS